MASDEPGQNADGDKQVGSRYAVFCSRVVCILAFWLVLGAFHRVEDGWSVISAIEHGDTQALSFHVWRGADMDQGWDHTNNPLAVAVLERDLDCSEIILQASADPNRLDGYSHVLHMCVSDVEMTKLLLEHGADPTFAQAPVAHAAGVGTPSTIWMLVSAGADPNGPDPWSCTPLHRAAEFGRLDNAMVLLGAGADPSITNRDGELPANTARSLGHPEIAEALERWGAGE